jgi:hypothetical protein
MREIPDAADLVVLLTDSSFKQTNKQKGVMHYPEMRGYRHFFPLSLGF